MILLCKLWLNVFSFLSVGYASNSTVSLNGLIKFSEAVLEVRQGRWLEIGNLLTVIHSPVDLRNVVDCLLRVILQRLLHVDKSVVCGIKLSDQEVE